MKDNFTEELYENSSDKMESDLNTHAKFNSNFMQTWKSHTAAYKGMCQSEPL